MGISSAMTTKERKQIHAGLIDQGCVVERDGKRGTLYKTPDGGRWMLPFGTSDHKARLAMRAEVRRLGLHWPLDPPDQVKKEKPVTVSASATVEGPTLTEHQRIPSTAQKAREAGWKPNETTYRKVEPLLRRYADKTFWTDEFSDEARREGLSGYQGGAGNVTAQMTLDFAGFRVVESKRNRNGYSYRWRRDALMPWPNEFASTLKGAALMRAQQRAARTGGIVTPLMMREAVASTALDGETFAFGTDEVEPIAEQAEVVTITDPAVQRAEQAIADADEATDDTELSLALEQERRANKAERDRDGLQVQLDKERRDHAATRRDLMVRLANRDQQITSKDEEIQRLRLMIEENAHIIRENPESGGAARAHRAEQEVQRLQEELAQHADALRIEREATTDLQKLLDVWQRRALDAEGKPHVGPGATPKLSPQGDNDWWPLEGGDQSVSQLIEGATAFGLEVRIQARRKDA